jgi:hypothetical protein
MGLTASLREPDLRVIPGQEVSAQVNLLNTGSVVDQVTVDVVGQAAAWSTVEPAVLNLYPGESGVARVTFHPPRSHEAPAGVVPFGVRAASREDPAGSIVEEGAIEVAAFTEFKANLNPKASRGRRRGRYRLTVVNAGNISAGAAVHFIDPEDQLAFRVSKPNLVAQPGVANVLRVQAIPRKRFMRGPNQQHPFQVMVAPDEGDSAIVDGELVQQPMLPAWAVPAAAALLALIILGTVLWFTLLKPTIKSAATEAANAQTTPLSAAVDQANKKAEQAQAQASQAAAAVAGGGANANPSGGANGSGNGNANGGNGNGTPGLTAPIEYRVQANAQIRGANDTNFDLFSDANQSKKPMDISDIQLQNPLGDSGIVQIRLGNQVWLTFGLDNFRDYDDHFVVPIHVNQGETVNFAVQCHNTNGKRCSAALTFSGRTTP